MKNYGVVYSKRKTKFRKLLNKITRSKKLTSYFGTNLKLYRSYETVEEAVNAIVNDPTIKDLMVKNEFYIIELGEWVMSKRIIIDGVVGTGRKGLYDLLAEEYGLGKGSYVPYLKGLSFNFYDLELDKDNLVSVGSFIGDPIYSKITETECLLTEQDIDNLVDKVEENNHIVIICLTTEDKRVKKQDKDVDKNIEELNKYFEKVAKTHNFILYDPNNESIIDLLKKLDKRMEDK